jgi:phosphoenolpyruvate-protein phosphotransferase (PTS system enzyme I)
VTVLTGLGASGGIAQGPAVRLRAQETTPVTDPLVALRTVGRELAALAENLEGEAADVLMAQSAMALDPEVHSAVEQALAQGSDGEAAVAGAFETFRSALSAAGSDYQRQRTSDLDEVSRRVVSLLHGVGATERWPPIPGILVAESVTAADYAVFPEGGLIGVVSGDGGDRSHAAILARLLGIPAILSVGRAAAELTPGKWLSIDGTTGVVKVLDAGSPRTYRRANRNGPKPDQPPDPAQTADGAPVDLRANVGALVDAEAASGEGLTSSGLVRTEFLFPAAAPPPAIRDQVTAYESILERLPGEVAFRLLDAGADKPVNYLPAPAAENPALAVRGLRLLLRHPEFLADQLRALCRTRTSDRVTVMLPMVSRASEVRDVRALARDVFESEGVELPIGAMLEVPVAALAVDELAADCDFFSLGTNDLLQYLFAADRQVGELDSIVDPLPRAVWALLARAIADAHAAGRPIGVCGELAAEGVGPGVLWGLGATSLSVSPLAVQSVRRCLRSRTGEQWRALAAELAGPV